MDAPKMEPVKVAETTTVSLADETSTAVVAVKTIKAGWKTTEFWAVVGVAVLAFAGHLPGPAGIIATAISAGLYAISRGIVKR